MERSRAPLTAADIDGLAWAKGVDGLLPAVVQDVVTRQVLVLAWMNREALAETLASGEVTFWSRSRRARWRKGETSGNRLVVDHVLADCDADALLVLARPTGPACHELTTSCFGVETAPGVGFLSRLEAIIAERAKATPEESYTARLLADGVARIAQKVGEEGVETALAAVTRDDDGFTAEVADLVYHLLVLMRARAVTLDQLLEALRLRNAEQSVP